MNRAWTLHIDSEWIAWLTIDVPGEKVNTLSASVMSELEALLDELADNEAIKAVAIRSGKPLGFIAGADIGELALLGDADDAMAKAQLGQAIFDKISALPVPTVAVIHGSCMGGGLELSLACDYRLVTDHADTALAAPEVKLGLIPGWGGTQRLPALVGLPTALTMILTGRTIARKAARCGLADGTVADAFIEQQTRSFIDRVLTRRGRTAVQRRRRKSRPRLMRFLESTGTGRGLIFRRAEKDVRAKTHGHYPAPLEALRVMRTTYGRRSISEGQGLEAEAFGSLACSDVSRHLVWLFQASRRMRKTHVAGDGALPLDRAGVIGGGIMGSGIAWAMGNAGMRVRLHDVSWEAVAAGRKHAAGMYRPLVKRRKMTENAVKLAMHRIEGTIDYTGFHRCDIVVEAIVEDMAIKQRVLQEIEQRVRPDTIICTNTSSLDLRELAGALKYPKRFLGLHFFNPVNRMPLVELVPTRKTSRAATVAAAELVRRMGKTPVVVGDCAGFLVNRILIPYLLESAWMFEEGVGGERIDRLLELFGMPMGPLALVDEVGIDVGYKVAKVLEGAYGNRMQVARALDHLVSDGDLLGRKSGRGFYLYDNGHKKLNPDVISLAADARAEDHIDERDLSDEDIVDRAVLIMVNEAARCIDEGVVDDAESLDMAMVMGTGFAPFRGGLLRYADERGISDVRDRLADLQSRFGERFTPAPLIDKLAKRSERFHHGDSSNN